MEEWKEYRLGDISSMRYGKLPPTSMGGIYPVWSGYRNVGTANTMNCSKGTMVVVARGVGGTGDVKIAKEDCYLTNLSIAVILDERICNPYYLHYKYLLNNLKYLDSGSAQSQITIDDLKRLSIKLPPLDYQNQIVAALKSFDDKIECNQLINDNLREQANTLFKSWFVDFEPFKDGEFTETELGMIPKGWQIVSLISVAKYLNGLAMQNYRPDGDDKGFPVLKIKELGQGMSDSSSDRCSSDIDKQYIVNDGDVIFSWSGTLLVDLWCGGQCGLNQHLFKVTSDDYPKWFFYMWTKQHLNKFIQIAKDKAVTMGHIKRGHLEEAKVLVPSDAVMNKMTATIQPIIDKVIERRIETRHLALIRDTILPKLMSGELKMNELTV